MLTVYIVDDERMAIEYLEYLLLRADTPCEVVGSATNSARALEEILRIEPDVVFTDISMPVMNGLELARRVLEKQRARIYLLTSYEDFQYAKQGVKLGVSDYILKNELSEAFLSELLTRAQAELLGERRARRLLLEQGVREFLSGEADAPPDFASAPNTRYTLMLLFPAWVPTRRGEEADASLPETMEPRAADGGEPRCEYIVRMKRGEYCAVAAARAGLADAEAGLLALAEALLEEMKEAGFGAWSCVIARPCERASGLRESYLEAERWRERVYAEPECAFFAAGRVPPRGPSGPEESDEYLEGIAQLLNARDRAGTLSRTRDFFAYGRKNLGAWEYGENARRLGRILRRLTLRNVPGAAPPPAPEGRLSAAETERFLLDCEDKYFDALEHSDARNYSAHIQRALEYIRKNYSRDILVADVAEAIGISGGHLRRLFKQELSTSVIDYLTDYRIEQAKVRMESGDEAFHEIWRGCGFSSAQYFGQVFKRREGVAPREYMNQLRRERYS